MTFNVFEMGSEDAVNNAIEVLSECVGGFLYRITIMNALMNKYSQSDNRNVYAEMNRHEVELFLKYKQYYGYLFFPW